MNKRLIICLVLVLGACTKKIIIKENSLNKNLVYELKNLNTKELIELEKLLNKLEEKSRIKEALMAQVYYSQENYEKASRYFSLASEKLPLLSPYFLMQKARSELKNNNLENVKSTLKKYESIKDKNILLEINKILAEVALREKDYPLIVSTNNYILKNGNINPVNMYNLAKAKSALNEHEEAHEIYKNIFIKFPKIAQEYGLRPDNFILSFTESKERFAKLLSINAFNDAICEGQIFLKKTEALNEEEKQQINTLLIQALVFSHQYEKALNLAQREAKSDQPLALENYAYALSKIGQLRSASKAYGHLYDVGEKDLKAKACFFKAFSLFESSLYNMARISFEGCRESLIGSLYYEDFLWYNALSSMLQNDFFIAKDYLDTLVKFKNDNQEKYTYFLAYTLQKLNDHSGHKNYLNILQKNKLGYYHLLAKKALSLDNIKGINIKSDALIQKIAPPFNEKINDIINLYKVGFKEQAILMAKDRNIDKNLKLSLMQYMGNFNYAFQKSYLLDAKVNVLDNKFIAKEDIRAAYPIVFEDLVKKEADKYGFPPSLIYALIKKESAFLESAQSTRGAIGLMQMIPLTAHDLALGLNVKFTHNDMLKMPEVAISLGTYLLAILQRQFAKEHLMLAAYNAGPLVVQKWLNEFGHLPVELFIERIPYKETRNYIKTVLSDESIYYALDGNALRILL